MNSFLCAPIRAVAVALTVAALAPVGFAEGVRFNRDVRPILSAQCYLCHGPDEAHREADLRLDQEAGVRSAFGGGLQESEAWRRINSDDPDERMPPPASHHELKPAEIETLRRWIAAGATWQGHWSLIAPRRPSTPDAAGDRWAANPIDAFILRRLRQQGLQPSREADNAILLRRIHFDLTGLPPSEAEIEAFLADTSPAAYEKVVDRLLASKHFGERMALVWMDAARYGDSSVFHADGPRDMWPWRDWVIRAYNLNKPFDQFTVEQLAGDLIPGATNEQQVATGFLRNNATTDEGGAIAEEYRVEYAVDRVKTTAMVWMGLSLECAQCHNHKYDPITMDDYYRFYAYFNQASDPGMQSRGGNQAPIVNVIVPDKMAEAASLRQTVVALDEQIKKRTEESREDFEKWLAEAAGKQEKPSTPTEGVIAHLPLDETVSDSVDAARKNHLRGKPQWAEGKFGKAFRCDGSNFIDLGQLVNFERTDSFSYGCWVKPQGAASGAPLAKMNDANAYRGFDLYTAGGHVAVHIIHNWPNNAIKVTTKAKLLNDQWRHVFTTYDGSSKAAGVRIYFDGKHQPHDVNNDALSGTTKTSAPLQIGRRHPGSPFKGLVDDVRIYNRKLTDAEVATLAGADPIGPLLAIAPEKRTEQQIAQLLQHYLNNLDKPYQELLKEKQQLQAKIGALEKPISTVMVMKDVPKMRPTYVLDRGHYASPLKDRLMAPNAPSAIAAAPKDAPPNRLGLARWLVQRDHPLTARVAVNRYWHMLFGAGLVRSLEDFGAQGEPPSHPDLLDWLAVDFVESGWDIKRMLKQMVMSSTYRQTSRITPELLARDPENRLLARGPRFRLAGEFIRDNALAASGLLVRKIGGPSVKPYQPPGLWNEVSLDGNVRFVQDHGEKLYRRSMYTYWKRSAPAPALTIFDTPTREKCSLRRSRTNTPLQPLVTLNDVQFVEAARALAQRVIQRDGMSLDERIALAHRLATGVGPSAKTAAVLREAYEEEKAVFAAQPERAKKLLAIGESKRDESIDPAEHAAMTIVASMILNFDATLTRG